MVAECSARRTAAQGFVALVSRSVGAVYPVPRRGLRVLLYHAIGSEVPDGTHGMSVSVQAFGEQMRWLREESGHELVQLRRSAASETTPGTAVAVTFDDGFRDVLTAAAPILVRYRIPFTVFVVGAYLETPPTSRLYIDRSELRDLAALPLASIGAHGFTHRPLTSLTVEALDDELQRSKESVATCLGTLPTAIAYPYGAVNRRVVTRAEAAGFIVGATSVGGVNPPHSPPLRIRRTEILTADRLPEFIGKVRGDYDWYRFRQCIPWPRPMRLTPAVL